MRTIAIMQARMGSARLPGKSLKAVAGAPMVLRVLERAALIPGIDGLVVATSLSDLDDAIAETVARSGFACVRGSEWDVLDRFHDAAEVTRADVIVRVTGDCPLLDPVVGGRVIEMFHANQPRVDYASNDTARSGFPDGTDVEVFSRLALTMARAKGMERHDREHVTRWMRRNLTGMTLAHHSDWSRMKWSVDCEDDLSRVRAIYGELAQGSMDVAFTYDAALKVEAREGVRV